MYIGNKEKENNSDTNSGISIFSFGNPFGYKYNVNHPKINDLYRRYKKWKGIPESSPMSNEQRREFERYIDGLLFSKENTEKNEG